MISKLILSSPFLEFNQSKIKRNVTQIAAKIAAAFLPYSKVDGASSSVYPRSLHKDYHGEWEFNLYWKPTDGFPTYFKWVLAVARAQKRLFSSASKLHC